MVTEKSYLLPLSYGTPDALGAWDFLELNERTIRVAMKGIIL
jgi:hypothetical protein